MEYLDYHETFPTRWEMTASYAICCAKCHETKLAKHFRRKLTRAQAVARGHALGLRNQADQPKKLQGERLATVESKFCTKCQPGHYKPNAMTIPEMYKAAYDGKASLTRVKIDAERKRKQARRKMSAAVSDRWAKWREAPWTHIRARLADALTSATHSVNYNRHRKIMKDEGVPEILAFYAAYQEVLRKIRAQCTINARTEATVEPHTTWAELAGPDSMKTLRALWDAIPDPAKGRMRTVPMLINKARPLVLEGYIAPNQDSIDRLNLVKK
jgi:hypothetical protein